MVEENFIHGIPWKHWHWKIQDPVVQSLKQFPHWCIQVPKDTHWIIIPPKSLQTPIYTHQSLGGRVSQRDTNVQFTQVKVTYQQHEEIAFTYGNNRAYVTYYTYQRHGNTSLFYPNRANIQQFQVTLNQTEVFITTSWEPLDSGSTTSIIFNTELVDNIW